METSKFKKDLKFLDGTFITMDAKTKNISILRGDIENGDYTYKAYVTLTDNQLWYNDTLCNMPDLIRFATEEEKNELLEKLKEDGMNWNFEKRCLKEI